MPNGAMVYNSTDINVTGNGTVGINWDSELYDDASLHSTTANTNRLTVPPGATRVRVGCNLMLNNVNDGTSVLCNIGKNGLTLYQSRAAATGDKLAGTTQQPRVSISSGPIPVEAGDYFELFVSDPNDTSFDIRAAGSNFWIEDAS